MTLASRDVTMFSSSLFWLALTTLYCVYCKEAQHTTHLWPLTSRTFGYDVKNNAHSKLVFADTSNFDSDGFVMDGRSFIDLPIADTLEKEYTISMCVKLEAASKGELIQYINNDGLATFTVSVRNNTVRCGSESSDHVSWSTGWIKLDILGEECGQTTLSVNGERLVTCSTGLSGPGTFRLGAAVNYTNYLEGKIKCFRTYDKKVDEGCLTGDCGSCDSRQHQQHLPERQAIYNKGYFDRVATAESPDCDDCDIINTTVRNTADCGSLCLQHSFCISFSVSTKRQQLPVLCLLYPYVFTRLVSVQNMRYYKVRLREP